MTDEYLSFGASISSTFKHRLPKLSENRIQGRNCDIVRRNSVFSRHRRPVQTSRWAACVSRLNALNCTHPNMLTLLLILNRRQTKCFVEQPTEVMFSPQIPVTTCSRQVRGMSCSPSRRWDSVDFCGEGKKQNHCSRVLK